MTAGRSNRRHRLIDRPDVDNDEVGARKRTAQRKGLTGAAGGAGDDDRAVCEQVVCAAGDLPGGGVRVAGVIGLCGRRWKANQKTSLGSQNRPPAAHGYPDTQTSL